MSHSYPDPGHTHSVYDAGYSHSISDPGHSHNISIGNCQQVPNSYWPTAQTAITQAVAGIQTASANIQYNQKAKTNKVVVRVAIETIGDAIEAHITTINQAGYNYGSGSTTTDKAEIRSLLNAYTTLINSYLELK